MQAQKESIPDRASVHAKKGDFGTKKQSCEAPISKQESHILFRYVFSRDFLCSLFSIGGDSLLWRVSAHTGYASIINHYLVGGR